MELSHIFKEINRLRNGIEVKGLVNLGQDPTQLNFQIVESTKNKD